MEDKDLLKWSEGPPTPSAGVVFWRFVTRAPNGDICECETWVYGGRHLTADPAGNLIWEPLSEISENKVIYSRPDQPHPAYADLYPGVNEEVVKTKEIFAELVGFVRRGEIAAGKLAALERGD